MYENWGPGVTPAVRSVLGETGYTLYLSPKRFATGNVGWHGQGKTEIEGCRCQVSVIVTVIGSKGQITEQKPTNNDETPESLYSLPKGRKGKKTRQDHPNASNEPPVA